MTFIPTLQSLPSATLPCFVAAVVFSTVAMASVPSIDWWPDAVPDGIAAVSAPAPQAGKAARGRAVCQACGVVETIRRFEPLGELPAGYELTVRMRDGSTRISKLASSAKWQAGDRIMLIGGAPAPAELSDRKVL